MRTYFPSTILTAGTFRKNFGEKGVNSEHTNVHPYLIHNYRSTFTQYKPKMYGIIRLGRFQRPSSSRRITHVAGHVKHGSRHVMQRSLIATKASLSAQMRERLMERERADEKEGEVFIGPHRPLIDDLRNTSRRGAGHAPGAAARHDTASRD